MHYLCMMQKPMPAPMEEADLEQSAAITPDPREGGNLSGKVTEVSNKR